MGDDLFTDFVHPNIRSHQRIAAAIAASLRSSGIPVPVQRWLDVDYEDTDSETLYAERPKLRTLELQSRVFTCAVVPRGGCLRLAHALLERDPSNRIGRSVVADLTAP